MDIWYADLIYQSILIQDGRFLWLFRRNLSFQKFIAKFKQILYRYIYHKSIKQLKKNVKMLYQQY